MSAQPTPEGPYHPAMDRLSVKFGPDEFQVKFSSPETVGTECILMNMGFAQGQASSAKEVEVYRKALENIAKLGVDDDPDCCVDCGDALGWNAIDTAMEALTSKPEPVAPVRRWELDDSVVKENWTYSMTCPECDYRWDEDCVLAVRDCLPEVQDALRGRKA